MVTVRQYGEIDSSSTLHCGYSRHLHPCSKLRCGSSRHLHPSTNTKVKTDRMWVRPFPTKNLGPDPTLRKKTNPVPTPIKIWFRIRAYKVFSLSIPNVHFFYIFTFLFNFLKYVFFTFYLLIIHLFYLNSYRR